MLNILAERQFPVDEIAASCSPRANRWAPRCSFGDKTLKTKDLDTFDFTGWDIALFAIGSEATKKYAPKAAKAGCVVIDNSSLYRYDPDMPLIVPEVNPEAVDGYAKKNIIANPNCSTAQMVVALKPLHDRAKIKRVVVSTYQSVSGAGKDGWTSCGTRPRACTCPVRRSDAAKFTKQIAFNVIPHIDVFMEDGSTKEEWKMVAETKKIVDPKIKVTPPACACRSSSAIPRRSTSSSRISSTRTRPARSCARRRHPGRRQARGRRLRHAGRMRRRLRHLHQPHPPGFDDRERPEPLVRLRQPAQGRGAERGADRRDAGQPGAEERADGPGARGRGGGRGRHAGGTRRARAPRCRDYGLADATRLPDRADPGRTRGGRDAHGPGDTVGPARHAGHRDRPHQHRVAGRAGNRRADEDRLEEAMLAQRAAEIALQALTPFGHG
jgi:hypothetical protein